MHTLTLEINDLSAVDVRVTADALAVTLSDGRLVAAPLAWFPRLMAGTPRERNAWRLIGGGEGIHWEHLDEDVSVEGLLAGRGSQESPKSLQRWLQSREEETAPVGRRTRARA
jgi:hypothetical protein